MSKTDIYRVNEFLSLRLEDEKTIIYVNGKRFRQCSYLLMVDPEPTEVNEIESIDDFAELIDKKSGWNEPPSPEDVGLSAEEEFMGHCSNLQAWAEHHYDARLLHSNLAFPLLKKLTKAGDPTAKRVFAEEIGKRYRNGSKKTRRFLVGEGYFNFLTLDEIGALLDESIAPLKHLIKEIGERPDFCYEKLNMLNAILLRDDKIVGIKLKYRHLTAVPDAVREFPNLEILKVSNRKIAEFPAWISQMKKLRVLDLSWNAIQGEVRLEGMPELRELDLSDNQIREISLANIPNLKQINISRNQFSSIFLEDFPNLRRLYLSKNELKNIEFNDLPHLEELYLSNNLIHGIDLEGFTNLRHLGIDFNPLDEVRGLGRAVNLESIGIKKTGIKDYKPFLQLDNLKTFFARNNESNEVNISVIKELEEKGVRVY